MRGTHPCSDWRLIRAAEASAREIGMRASTPDSAAAGTAEYAADLARWGDGRNIALTALGSANRGKQSDHEGGAGFRAGSRDKSDR